MKSRISGTEYKNTILRKYPQRKRKSSSILRIQKDETVIKVGSEYIWIWVVIIEQKVKEILGINISKTTKYRLSQGDLFRKLWINMDYIQFQQTAVPGTTTSLQIPKNKTSPSFFF